MNSIYYDVVIIGGGVMGLLSAYRIRQAGLTVAIIDAGKIGGTQAASSGFTRSIRNDYENIELARMANDAFRGWRLLQREWKAKLIEECGCLNLFNQKLVKTKINEAYVTQALSWLERDERRLSVFAGQKNFSIRLNQFSAQFGVLDKAAGIALPREVNRQLLIRLLNDDAVTLYEDTTVLSIEETVAAVYIKGAGFKLIAQKLVIAAGLGTSKLCNLVQDAPDLPITPDRPFELKYFFPKNPIPYTVSRLPVFAFLDVGIYGHPIVPGLTEGVKIGFYQPPGLKSSVGSGEFINRFVQTCLPDLYAQSSSSKMENVDTCSYDMTPDRRFILGYLTGNKNIIVAAGFNGTGYKFAPVITDIVKDLVLGEEVGYDIQPFSSDRFNCYLADDNGKK